MSQEKYRKTRRSKLAPAADVLQSLLQNVQSPLGDQFLRWRLWRNWSEVVGPTISEHAMPVAYDNGILYIWVKSASWMHHMQFVADALKDKINKYTGRPWARQVRFTLDRRSVPVDRADFPPGV